MVNHALHAEPTILDAAGVAWIVGQGRCQTGQRRRFTRDNRRQLVERISAAQIHAPSAHGRIGLTQGVVVPQV